MSNSGATYAPKYDLSPEDFGARGNGVTNDTDAINKMFAALPAGGTIRFNPAKRYMTDGGHICTAPSAKIIGASGRAQTYNSSAQLYLRGGANKDLLTIAGNQTTIRDLSLYGNYINQTGPSNGLVTPPTSGANYILLDAVWVESFNGDNYSLQSSGGTLSGTMTNCESRLARGYGANFYGTSTDFIINGGYFDQNVQSGIMCTSGDLAIGGQTHIWGNGTGSTGNLDGITFQSAGGCRINGAYIESQLNGAGIRFKSGTNTGHIVTGCDLWNNGLQGIYGFSADHCLISNNKIRQNNYKGQTGATGAGIHFDTCTAMNIQGNIMLSSGAQRQTYGYYGLNNTDCLFMGNISRAADHTTGNWVADAGTTVPSGTNIG